MLNTQVNDEGGGIKTLILSGSIDTPAASQMEAEGMSIISKGCKALVIDVSELQFISSAGLRVVYLMVKKARPLGIKLVISGAAGLVKHAITASGFDSFVPLKETRAEAVAACSSAGEANDKPCSRT